MKDRSLMWLTLRDTGWYESVFRNNQTILVRGYNMKRSDGDFVDVIITAAPQDDMLIRQKLEFCASLMLRSYDGCECSKAGPCRVHARIKDISVWGKCPGDAQKTGESLRTWAAAMPDGFFVTNYGFKVGA